MGDKLLIGALVWVPCALSWEIHITMKFGIRFWVSKVDAKTWRCDLGILKTGEQ
jgi:hypothetical protein